MKLGVVFPQTEIGRDPAMIRDYAQAVEATGYTHILAFDSVVGANPDRPRGWDSPYTYRHAFHEPFALFAFCAAVTRRIEFEALGENIHDRGRRIQEQLEVMRLLWTRELVSYEGRWHHVPGAGIKPLPVQQPIPGWMGARARRSSAARPAAPTAGSRWRPSAPIEGRVALAQVPPEARAKELATWRAMRGITHLCVNTMGLGLPGPEEHVGTLERFWNDVLK